jgi:hypothetical protein
MPKRFISRFTFSLFKGLKALKERLIIHWGILLLAMFCFAINRYAVSFIYKEQKNLRQLLIELQTTSKQLEEQLQLTELKISQFDDPRFQEMLIMKHLLLFPESTTVYHFECLPDIQAERKI